MERFKEKLCSVAPLWRISLAFILVLLSISVFSFIFVTPGTKSYYITVVNFLVLGPLLVTNLVILYTCQSRSERKELEYVDSVDSTENN